MYRERDIAWFAGLYEGEGSVWAHHKSATIEISMTDREPLEKCHELFGGSLSDAQPRGPVESSGGPRKDRYRWTLNGVGAAIFVYELIEDVLSPRRRAQFERVIGECDTFDQKPVGPPCIYRGHTSRGADAHRERGEAPCLLCREKEREYKAGYRNTGERVRRA